MKLIFERNQKMVILKLLVDRAGKIAGRGTSDRTL